jgi:hypothetical protein
MRNNANFHPEWGYLAPAPRFIRTVRVVLIATAVGAAIGGVVGFSWIGHPAESSVAARTLVQPVKAPSTRANTLAQLTNEPRASSATGAQEGIMALSEAPAATDEPATAVIATPPTTAKQAAFKAPVKKRATKKPNLIWRYASREEPFGLQPGEYYARRSADEYPGEARGRYYSDGGRDGGRWGSSGGRRYPTNW